MIQRNLTMWTLQIALICILLGGLAPARAEGIIVNGAPATFLDLLVLVNWNCGEGIPDGDYWVDVGTGAWGYAGGVQQGRLPCHSSAAARTGEPASETSEDVDGTSSTWEDRMCARGLCGGVIVNPVYP
jgi:hypothetical protein